MKVENLGIVRAPDISEPHRFGNKKEISNFEISNLGRQKDDCSPRQIKPMRKFAPRLKIIFRIPSDVAMKKQHFECQACG